MLSANPTVAKLGFLIVLSLVASGYTAIVVFGQARRRAGGGGESPRPVSGTKPWSRRGRRGRRRPLGRRPGINLRSPLGHARSGIIHIPPLARNEVPTLGTTN